MIDILMPRALHQDVPVRTTLTLDDDVRARLDSEMRKSGKSFKETVNETLRAGLLSQKRPRSANPYKVQAKAMGLKSGYSHDKVWELLEQVEGPGYK